MIYDEIIQLTGNEKSAPKKGKVLGRIFTF